MGHNKKCNNTTNRYTKIFTQNARMMAPKIEFQKTFRGEDKNYQYNEL